MRLGLIAERSHLPKEEPNKRRTKRQPNNVNTKRMTRKEKKMENNLNKNRGIHFKCTPIMFEVEQRCRHQTVSPIIDVYIYKFSVEALVIRCNKKKRTERRKASERKRKRSKEY